MINILDDSVKKHLIALRESAKRAKSILCDILQKSQKTFENNAGKAKSEKEQTVILNKVNRISKELDILKGLLEDDIIAFALTSQQKLAAIAANKRLPLLIRMKARVACHKPLLSHLLKIKNKLEESDGSESEEETVNETCKTLDKITVNNQVVKLRKNVRRAKVHLIHKLTRNVQLLRKSKAVGEKKAKFERKAERLVKMITHIKELLDDDVSKFAITNTQDLSKLYTDIKIPMRTRAQALIAAHKFVAEPVSEFKSAFPNWEKDVPKVLKRKKKKRKLNIESEESIKCSNKTANLRLKADRKNSDSEYTESENEVNGHEEESDKSDDVERESSEEEDESAEDSNEDTPAEDHNNAIDNDTSNLNTKYSHDEQESNESETDLRTFRKAQQKTVKKIDEKLPSLKLKKNTVVSKVATGKRNSVLQHISKSLNSLSQENIKQPSEHILSLKTNFDTSTINKESASNSSSEDSQENAGISSDEETAVAAGSRNKKRREDLTNFPNKNKQTCPNVKLKKKTVSSSTDNSPHKNISVSKPIKSELPTVDPFFVTTTNTEYVTHHVPAVIEGNSTNWKTEKEDLYRKKSNHFNKFDTKSKWSTKKESGWKQSKFNPRESQFHKRPFSSSFEKVSNVKNNERPIISLGNRKERRKALQQSLQKEKVEKLHPSWEAKKKLSTIVSFQGKKVVFD